jgi:hypothetical protein
MWEPGTVPATTDPRHRAPVMTPGRHPDDDVVRARHGVRSATTTYGPRRPRRTLADVWQDFAHRYGWRAYALPVLFVVTVAALIPTTGVGKKTLDAAAGRGGGSHRGGGVQPPVASSSMTLKNDAPGANANGSVLRATALPAGPSYTKQGTGTFRVLTGHTAKVGSGQLYRYTIDVENGVDGVDLRQFQNLVVSTLTDPRSWAGHGVALQRVDSGPADFHVTLTSAMTVRNLCGYDVPVETSCYAQAGAASDVNRVVLNIARWTRGATAYVGDLAAYRIYMINHEDGHALGHLHAHQCLPGGLAPVMMQQTFGLRSAADGQLCEANPWPYPTGVRGAPGAEQPDTPQNDEYGLGD